MIGPPESLQNLYYGEELYNVSSIKMILFHCSFTLVHVLGLIVQVPSFVAENSQLLTVRRTYKEVTVTSEIFTSLVAMLIITLS